MKRPPPRVARKPPADTERSHLLTELDDINRALKRLHVEPYIDEATAQALPLDNLRTIVKACADHLAGVHRQLKGIG